MNFDQQATTQDTATAAGAAELPPTSKPDNPLAKFDAGTLRGITSTAIVDPGVTAFLPQNMAEAMEFAKLMAASNFVPPHLRGKPGDCLAIVLQSARWGADPYAVANKTYFVNDRMAFEAQLVNAVVNSSNVLNGRLEITWQGAGPTLQCTVRGRIRGDQQIHELIQESKTITTKNSPLWKQAEKVQLAYYTSRAWARLFTPEVLLGIYTPDELEAENIINPKPGTQQVIPPSQPRPTRESVRADAEKVRKAEVDNSRQFRDTLREEPPQEQPSHDAETGEIEDEGAADAAQEPEREAEQPAAAEQTKASRAEPMSTADHEAIAATVMGKIKTAATRKALDNITGAVFAQEIETLRIEAPELNARVQAEIKAKKDWFAR